MFIKLIGPDKIMKLHIFYLIFGLTMSVSCDQAIQKNLNSNTREMKNDSLKFLKSEEEWKMVLSPEQYRVLRQKGTEAPGTGKYYMHHEKGLYVCAACGNELFTSDMKFDSHCGWPSFDREIEGGKIATVTDSSHGMQRTEILCGKCGSHLGHIFDDGPTETGMRYCVNSVSLDFKDSISEGQ